MSSTTIEELPILAGEARRVSDLLRSSDHATPITHLGRWKIRDVGAHLGGVHRWAARTVITRSREGPGATKSKLDGTELCDWFDAGVDELLLAFQSHDVDGQCPNFNPGSAKTVGWWLRRQLHETTIHRWDIEQSLGATTAIDLAVAADGIDEFLDVFVRTRGKQTLAAPLRLSSSTPAQAWTLVPAKKPGRIDIIPGTVGDSAAVVSGNPDQILLALWNRLTVAETDLMVTGDPTVAASMLTL